MARLVEAVKCAEIISEKFNIPLADLVDVFAEIPTADNEEHTHTKRKRWGEVSIVLFAIVGATIKAGVGYWICFSVYCLIWLIRLVAKLIED